MIQEGGQKIKSGVKKRGAEFANWQGYVIYPNLRSPLASPQDTFEFCVYLAIKVRNDVQ